MKKEQVEAAKQQLCEQRLQQQRTQLKKQGDGVVQEE